MKKLLLFIALFFAAFSFGFAQNKNVADTTKPYKFSWKNGWAVKVNPLQLITDYEFRLYLEKRISDKSSLEIYGSYLFDSYPKLDGYFIGNTLMFAVGNYGDLKSSRKIGFGYRIDNKNYRELKNTSIVFDLQYRFEKRERDDYINEGYVFYEVTKGTHINIFENSKIICLQLLFNKRLENKFLLLDFYLGIGVRKKWIDYNLMPVLSSINTEPINNSVNSNFLFSPQIGINLGFKIN